jgi:hypothetical protein
MPKNLVRKIDMARVKSGYDSRVDFLEDLDRLTENIDEELGNFGQILKDFEDTEEFDKRPEGIFDLGF